MLAIPDGAGVPTIEAGACRGFLLGYPLRNAFAKPLTDFFGRAVGAVLNAQRTNAIPNGTHFFSSSSGSSTLILAAHAAP